MRKWLRIFRFGRQPLASDLTTEGMLFYQRVNHFEARLNAHSLVSQDVLLLLSECERHETFLTPVNFSASPDCVRLLRFHPVTDKGRPRVLKYRER